MQMPLGVHLKRYQKDALECLDLFLQVWDDLGSVSDAFHEVTGKNYHVPDWNSADKELRRWVPSLCLAAGTGAGKTLMAATWLKPIAGSVAGGPVPLRLVLWLVPSKTLIEQTIRVLRDPRGMYAPLLAAAFGHVNVASREAALTLTPGQLGNGITIVVSTAQGFRREEVEGLRAFRQNGALMDHFASGASSSGSWISEDGRLYDGTAVPSLVNLARLCRPVVVVDEAHRNQGSLSWQMLSNLRPRWVLELTATPREGANVLYTVLPLDLKVAEMIRLPVIVNRADGWMDALSDSARNREELETRAQGAGERIRPIVLVQAEAKDEAHSKLAAGRVAIYDVVYFLTRELAVPRNQIAIRTGDVDELSGKDLLAADCPIRFVLTVQAAAEGWDCPYATTLCAIATTRSRVRVTQLLGRCLRQDLGRRSPEPELNKAYVFSATPDFEATAAEIVASMEELGFSTEDVQLNRGRGSRPRDREAAALRDWLYAEKVPCLALIHDGQQSRCVDAPEEYAAFAPHAVRRDAVQFPLALLQAEVRAIDLDVDGKLVQTELNMQATRAAMYEEFDEATLVETLCRTVRDKRVKHADMVVIISETVGHFVQAGWSASDLFGRYRLFSSQLAAEVRRRSDAWLASGLGAADQSGRLTTEFVALPGEVVQPNGNYPALDLSRHAYDGIAPMNSDERQVAGALSRSSKVKWWWRNPERSGWKIVGAYGRFYPDFLARLTDDRLVALEYKGPQLLGIDDTLRKEELGQLWARTSGHRTSFYMLTSQPDPGRPMQMSHQTFERNVLGLAP